MTIVLLSFLIAETVVLAIVYLLYQRSSSSLTQYQSIADIEKYKADCAQQAQEALIQRERWAFESTSLQEQITQQKEKAKQYQILLGNLTSAAELQQRIRDDQAKVQKLAVALGKLQRASELDGFLRNQESKIAQRRNELDLLDQLLHGARSLSELGNLLRTQESAIAQRRTELASLESVLRGARTAQEIAAQVQYFENYLAVLKSQIEQVEEAGELQEFGFYRPHYDFESSEEYKNRLERNRERQKTMLKSNTSCVCTTEWSVDGNKREGQKMTNQQIKLMLRAFNGECDAAVSKVRYNNVVSLENRIKKSFEQINKLGETKRIHLVDAYYELKFEELRLSHEYQQKRQEEKEVQQAIREQMREEEKVRKEVELAQATAEKEERVKEQALERAREELAQTTGRQTAKLEMLVAKLENELQEAIDRKAKAIARAQLTRSGHVYVLSNIGSFGEGIYKIGLTRRLEPLERVAELGSASVPFEFDVHAMIYSEDAPALERTLHQLFAARRVNMVNLRREFFRVSLDEIRAAVAQNFGHISFVTIPQAAQYRQTLSLMSEQKQQQPAMQIA